MLRLLATHTIGKDHNRFAMRAFSSKLSQLLSNTKINQCICGDKHKVDILWKCILQTLELKIQTQMPQGSFLLIFFLFKTNIQIFPNTARFLLLLI